MIDDLLIISFSRLNTHYYDKVSLNTAINASAGEPLFAIATSIIV